MQTSSEPAAPSNRGTELALAGQHSLVRRRENEATVVDSSYPPPPWTKPEWQKLWLALEKEEWRTLALVPSGVMPEGFTLEIAVALVHTGSVHLGSPIRIADGTDVSLPHLKQFVEGVQSLRDRGDRVIIALGPVLHAATAVTIAQAADRALLCVPLQQSLIKDARKTIEAVGTKQFIGSGAFEI